MHTQGYKSLLKFYNWKKLHQDCNKYVRSCTESQQVTLKEPQNINLHLPILQFPMSFITMDLIGPNNEIENGKQYVLTVICMLSNHVFMVLIRAKTTDVI